MDFGQGAANEYVWMYTHENQEKQLGITLADNMKKNHIKISKVIDKWKKAFIVDSKYSHRLSLNREGKAVSMGHIIEIL